MTKSDGKETLPGTYQNTERKSTLVYKLLTFMGKVGKTRIFWQQVSGKIIAFPLDQCYNFGEAKTHVSLTVSLPRPRLFWLHKWL